MNRKTFVSITLFLYTLLLIFEYPGLFYPGMHQGTDSWGNVAVSNSINDKGHDIRFRHVLSFFGLSPYSNSMGAAFFLSAFRLISDIPVIKI